jgi:hypothetical protein
VEDLFEQGQGLLYVAVVPGRLAIGGQRDDSEDLGKDVTAFTEGLPSRVRVKNILPSVSKQWLLRKSTPCLA